MTMTFGRHKTATAGMDQGARRGWCLAGGVSFGQNSCPNEPSYIGSMPKSITVIGGTSLEFLAVTDFSRNWH